MVIVKLVLDVYLKLKKLRFLILLFILYRRKRVEKVVRLKLGSNHTHEHDSGYNLIFESTGCGRLNILIVRVLTFQLP